MVAVIAAALLLGAAVGRALPPTTAAGATAQGPSAAPEATTDFVYFPSQYQPDFNPAAQVGDIQAF
jgi:hypothetical protein